MARLRQLLRYGAVSLVATTTSLVVLGVLVSFRWVSPGRANVAPTGAGADRAAVEPWLRTSTVELANAAAFGSLWIAQFVIFDRILFADRRRAGPQMAMVPRPPFADR